MTTNSLQKTISWTLHETQHQNTTYRTQNMKNVSWTMLIGAIKGGLWKTRFHLWSTVWENVEHVMARLTAGESERALGMFQVGISSTHGTAVWMPPFNNH